MSLYSPAVFMPTWFKKPTERVTLVYSKHAKYACNNDRYGAIPVFETLPLDKFDVVEFEADGEKVTKVVMRGKMNEQHDCIFVLIPGDRYFVKTVWLNERNDKHKTLDRSRYVGG